MTSHVYFWYQITAARLSTRDTVLTFQCCLVVWVTSAESGSGTQFHNTTITFLFNLLFIIEAVIIFLLTTPQACRLTPQQQINPLILLPAMCNLLTFLSERERRCKKGFSLSLWMEETNSVNSSRWQPTNCYQSWSSGWKACFLSCSLSFQLSQLRWHHMCAC